MLRKGTPDSKDQMKKFKVNRSKEPSLNQLYRMTKNLELLSDITYARISVNAISYITSSEIKFSLALQPGLDGTDCSINYFSTWTKCQDFYFQLMKGE